MKGIINFFITSNFVKAFSSLMVGIVNLDGANERIRRSFKKSLESINAARGSM